MKLHRSALYLLARTLTDQQQTLRRRSLAWAHLRCSLALLEARVQEQVRPELVDADFVSFSPEGRKCG